MDWLRYLRALEVNRLRDLARKQKRFLGGDAGMNSFTPEELELIRDLERLINAD